MNEVQLFQNEQFGQVRVVIQDGEPWFVLNDVCKSLGIANPRNVSARLDEEQKGVHLTDGLGGKQNTTIINEAGLYEVIIRSEKPESKKFRKWVTSEVLPSIRKHGAYMTPEKLQEAILNPDTMIQLATQLKKEMEARKKAEQQIEQDKPKVVLANAITASTNSILVRDLAKIITQNGYEIGEKRLYKLFREMGYLIKKQGLDHNRPTQFSMNKGLFEVKENTVENKDGSILTKFTTLVTGKGQMYFINKFKEWAEIEDKDNQG